MNYLAHLHLAADTALARLGNLSGDFVQGVDVTTLSAPLRRGIAAHRAIDRFTDAHATVRASKARIGPSHRRFAGVLVDVFYDHFLALHWSRYDARPFEDFRNQCYSELEEHRSLLPPRLRAAVPTMIAADWLGAYRSLEGIQTVLERMSRRLRRPNPLASGAAELARSYGGLRAEFTGFYPEVRRMAAAIE